MQTYAAAIRALDLPPDQDTWIEFYQAEDWEHAQEQAKDAHRDGDQVVAIAGVPE